MIPGANKDSSVVRFPSFIPPALETKKVNTPNGTHEVIIRIAFLHRKIIRDILDLSSLSAKKALQKNTVSVGEKCSAGSLPLGEYVRKDLLGGDNTVL